MSQGQQLGRKLDHLKNDVRHSPDEERHDDVFDGMLGRVAIDQRVVHRGHEQHDGIERGGTDQSPEE